jgi:RNA polymerase subunit RPABC4/transcription elongation factor Spt4
MYCENCGAEISDKAKFCKECGVNLSNGHNNVNNEENSSFGENKFCFECGADVSEDIKFCSSCGASLTGIGDVESKKELISKPVSLDNTKNDNTTKNKDNKKFKINNKYLAIGGLILLILILGSFLIMELSKPPEVTYENYPDIPKKVIDRFNELDLNNDTFIIPGEYGGKGYPSVWYALEGEGYANHTVKYDDSDVPAMDVNDYNRAYNVEQK